MTELHSDAAMKKDQFLCSSVRRNAFSVRSPEELQHLEQQLLDLVRVMAWKELPPVAPQAPTSR